MTQKILSAVLQSTTIDQKSRQLLRYEKCQKKLQVLRIQILLEIENLQIRFGWINMLGGLFRLLISYLEGWLLALFLFNFDQKFSTNKVAIYLYCCLSFESVGYYDDVKIYKHTQTWRLKCFLPFDPAKILLFIYYSINIKLLLHVTVTCNKPQTRYRTNGNVVYYLHWYQQGLKVH